MVPSQCHCGLQRKGQISTQKMLPNQGEVHPDTGLGVGEAGFKQCGTSLG